MSLKKESAGDRVFLIIVYVVLFLFTAMVIYPLIWIVSCSFSDPYEFLAGNVVFLPIKPTTIMYQVVFNNSLIWTSYKNTVIYTVSTTVLSVVLSALMAYPLSRRIFFGKSFFTVVLMITMFFSGGMIPNFLLIESLGLLDSMWAIILPGCISVYNTIVMRSFYVANIPEELEESAFLDGANDIQFFVRVGIPLSKAIIAVMVLFYAVPAWNSWFSAFLYLSSREKYPLQLILRETLMSGGGMGSFTASGDRVEVTEGIKYATMVVATVPIMCVYPFIQKYFTKGVMVGSLKG